MLLLLISGIAGSPVLNAQPLEKFSEQEFNVNQGLLESHVVALTEDEKGFLWISTGAGLQVFDGSGFRTIVPQPGPGHLPQTNYIRFLKLRNGNIWMATAIGIYSYDPVSGGFHTIYPFKPYPGKSAGILYHTAIPLTPLAETREGVWCWSLQDSGLVCLDRFSHREHLRIPFPDSLLADFADLLSFHTDTAHHRILIGDQKREIIMADLRTNRIRDGYSMPGYLKDRINAFDLLGRDTLLICGNRGIYQSRIGSESTRMIAKLPSGDNPDQINYETLLHLQGGQFLLSINNELYTLDGYRGKFLKRLVDLRNDPFDRSGYITGCLLDPFHHLWVITLAEGLKKVNFSDLGIRYYGTGDPKKNFVRSIYADKKANLLLAGTLYHGILAFDTSGHLLKRISLGPSQGQVIINNILRIHPGTYLLLTTGTPAMYILHGSGLTLSPAPAGIQSYFRSHPGMSYYSSLEGLSDSTALVYSIPGLGMLHYSSKGSLRIDPLPRTYNGDCILMDHKGRLWVGGTGGYSLYQGPGWTLHTSYTLREPVMSKCLFQDFRGRIWLGTEKGLYQLDPASGRILRYYGIRNGMADDCIYSLQEDQEGNLWFGTNKGISCLRTDGSFQNLYATDGLQGSEFNTQSSARSSDGELYFGGVDGINSFYPEQIRTPPDKPRLLLTGMKVMDKEWSGDTATWNLRRIRLPHNRNILSFSFTAMGWYPPGYYRYRYRMLGLERNWVDAGNRGDARFVLPPGDYTFQYALLDPEGTGFLKSKGIQILIDPPLWQAPWFLILVLLLLAGILLLLIQGYHRRRYRGKLRQLELRNQLQQERERISRDLHDHIGSYATALIARVDHLKELPSREIPAGELQSVSDHARNIMGSLQETIWVLNKETLRLTDFSDRFKLYARRILEPYAGINLHMEESISQDYILSPREALHIFRIMQEALQNALKHGHPGHIWIYIQFTDHLALGIRDDGEGFDPQATLLGNGLRNMQYRASELGYDLSIIREEGQTRIGLEQVK